MVEYLYDAVRGIAGESIDIIAEITDSDGNNIESGCSLVLIDKDNAPLLNKDIDGIYLNGTWTFTIPADITYYMDGRYWYRIRCKGESLSFDAPLYVGV